MSSWSQFSVLDDIAPWVMGGLAIGGFLAGILAGFLGIGGGTILVPLMVTLGFAPVQAVATSSLAILITSLSGSLQNWRMGYLRFPQVLALGLPALLTAQIGAFLANYIAPYLLLLAFGLVLWLNIALMQLRRSLLAAAAPPQARLNPRLAQLLTGAGAGLLAGLFGVGGGVVLVPLQMLFLGEAIKMAIQTSLAVIVMTAISAAFGHAWNGHVLVWPGLLLGTGGLLGAQVSTRFLPKLPDRAIAIAFCTLLTLLSGYTFWQAWRSYLAVGAIAL